MKTKRWVLSAAVTSVLLSLLYGCTIFLPTPTPAPRLPVLAGTPVPIPQEPITSENLDRLTELAIWGQGGIEQVAFSPDGEILAVGTTIGIWLYDAETLERIRFLKTPAWVGAFAFSADGEMLHADVGASTLLSWQVSTGELVRSLRVRDGYKGSVRGGLGDVAFSQDGAILAAALEDQTIGIWDVESGARLHVLQGHQDVIDVLTLSADGSLLASAALDGTTWIWDTETGTHLQTLADGSDGQAFSLDGALLVTGAELWEIETGRLLYTQPDARQLQDTPAINMCAASSSGGDNPRSLFASGWWGGVILLWDAETGDLSHTLKAHERVIVSLGFSPDARVLASASGDGTVRVWDTETGQPLGAIKGSGTGLEAGCSDPAAVFLPDNTVMLSTRTDSEIKIWDLHTGQTPRTLTGHTSRVLHLATSADGKVLVSSEFESYSVRIWDIETGRHLRDVGDVANPVSSLALTSDGAMVALRGGWAHWAAVYDVQTGEALYGLSGNSTCRLAFSPDDSGLATGWLEMVELWDMETGESLHKLDLPGFLDGDPQFSPDGKVVAASTCTAQAEPCEGEIWVWDVETGEVIRRLGGHPGGVGFAFSPDGALLAAGVGEPHRPVGTSPGPVMWLWDVDTGTRLRVLEGYNSSAGGLAFSPDGTMLMSTGDCVLKLWGVPPDD